MKKIYIYLSKILFTVIIMLVVLILIKRSDKFKMQFYKKIYCDNFDFSYVNNLYTKYIKNEQIDDTVFNESISYNKIEKYIDGAKLYVDDNYLVKCNKSGIVIYIGEKENYGNTVIIQRSDGIDELYGNIENINVKLYDYIDEDTIIGSTNNYFYLVYKKDGDILNYEEYIY